MGNGASTTSNKVVLIGKSHGVGKDDDGNAAFRPSSRVASSKSSRSRAEESLPGAVSVDVDRPQDVETQLRERIHTLEQIITTETQRRDASVIVYLTAPLEEQWKVVTGEVDRLRALGYSFPDPRRLHYEQTCQSQTQVIMRQEQDLVVMREEVTKLKEKCERRIKRERAKLAKTSAEISLQVFELKEQVARLTDANTLLQREVDSATQRRSRASTSPEAPEESGGHTRLILDLSTRISELTDELELAQATIEELRGAA